MAKATVILFKPSGKYYTDSLWEIPTLAQVLAGGGNRGDAMIPYCMRYSPDFQPGWIALVETQEPWGYPHLILPERDDTADLLSLMGGGDVKAVREVLARPAPEGLRGTREWEAWVLEPIQARSPSPATPAETREGREAWPQDPEHTVTTNGMGYFWCSCDNRAHHVLETLSAHLLAVANQRARAAAWNEGVKAADAWHQGGQLLPGMPENPYRAASPAETMPEGAHRASWDCAGGPQGHKCEPISDDPHEQWRRFV